jgi:hypothetical protein
MTELKNSKPIGGVVRAVLYAVGELSSREDIAQREGIEVELVDDGSSYEEAFRSAEGLVSVEHTLTLCSQRKDASPWLDTRFVERAAVEGVVAEIVLASGESVVVGWSERFGFEQALRIKEILFLSGKRPTDLPRVVLTLCSKDTKSAIV